MRMDRGGKALVGRGGRGLIGSGRRDLELKSSFGAEPLGALRVPLDPCLFAV